MRFFNGSGFAYWWSRNRERPVSIVAMLAAYIKEYPGNLIALAANLLEKQPFRMRESVLQTLKKIDLPVATRQKIIDSAKATTLHRLLGSKIGSVDFHRNKKNPLPHDLWYG